MSSTATAHDPFYWLRSPERMEEFHRLRTEELIRMGWEPAEAPLTEERVRAIAREEMAASAGAIHAVPG